MCRGRTLNVTAVGGIDGGEVDQWHDQHKLAPQEDPSSRSAGPGDAPAMAWVFAKRQRCGRWQRHQGDDECEHEDGEGQPGSLRQDMQSKRSPPASSLCTVMYRHPPIRGKDPAVRRWASTNPLDFNGSMAKWRSLTATHPPCPAAATNFAKQHRQSRHVARQSRRCFR